MSTGQEHLEELRARAAARREASRRADISRGERAADLIAGGAGSWRFIISQSFLLLLWIGADAAGLARFDPYPFILLNLFLSFQAAYTAPIILMSQNRLGDLDRKRSSEDFEINKRAELKIESPHEKVDLSRETEIAALKASGARLAEMLAGERGCT